MDRQIELAKSILESNGYRVSETPRRRTIGFNKYWKEFRSGRAIYSSSEIDGINAIGNILHDHGCPYYPDNASQAKEYWDDLSPEERKKIDDIWYESGLERYHER